MMNLITLEERLSIISLDGRSIESILLEVADEDVSPEQNIEDTEDAWTGDTSRDKRYAASAGFSRHLLVLKQIDNFRREAARLGLTREFVSALGKVLTPDKIDAFLISSDSGRLREHALRKLSSLTDSNNNPIAPSERRIAIEQDKIKEAAKWSIDDTNKILSALLVHFKPKWAERAKAIESLKVNAAVNYAKIKDTISRTTGIELGDTNLEKVLSLNPTGDAFKARNIPVTYKRKDNDEWVTEEIPGAELLENKIQKLADIFKLITPEHNKEAQQEFRDVAYALNGLGDSSTDIYVPGILSNRGLSRDEATYVAFNYAFAAAIKKLNDIHRRESSLKDTPTAAEATDDKSYDKLLKHIESNLQMVDEDELLIIKKQLEWMNDIGPDIDDPKKWIMLRIKKLAYQINNQKCEENKRNKCKLWVDALAKKIEELASTGFDVPDVPVSNNVTMPNSDTIIFDLKNNEYKKNSQTFQLFVMDVPGFSYNQPTFKTSHGDIKLSELQDGKTIRVLGDKYFWHVTAQKSPDGIMVITKAENAGSRIKKKISESIEIPWSIRKESFEHKLTLI